VECGPVAGKVGGVGGLSVYIIPNFSRSACLRIVIFTFWCPDMSSHDVTTRLAAVSTKSLPLMYVCPLILCTIVGKPSLILCGSEVTMAAISSFW